MMDRGCEPRPIGSDEDFAPFLQLDLAKAGELIREKDINVSG